MKNLIFTLKQQALVLVILCYGMAVMAEPVIVTVSTRDVTNTGTGTFSNLQQTIEAVYTTEQIAAITDLKIITSGQAQHSNNNSYDVALEANDFKYINNMTNLENLDLSDALVTNNNYTNRGVDNSFPGNGLASNKSIKHIVLPSTMTGIGGGAFTSCALEGIVDIPIGVTNAALLEANIWGNSQKINGFNPASPTIVVEGGVVFNSNKTTLHYYPSGKTDVRYIIPNSVEIIRNNAFEYNHYLKSLIIGTSVNGIHTTGTLNYTAIANHSEIDSILVASGHDTWGSANGLLYEKATNKLVWSPRGRKEVRIPSVIQILAGGGSQNAIFGGNANNSILGINNNYTKVITLVDLPSTIVEIGNGAFVGADNLAVLICRATTVPTNYATTFNNVASQVKPSGIKIYVPASALNDYKNSSWANKYKNNEGTIEWTDNNWKGFGNGTGTGTNGSTNQFYAFYNVSITNGTASSPLASDIAASGHTVTITAAPAPAGKIFDKWIVEEESSAAPAQQLRSTTAISVANENASTTTFVMPSNHVTVTATYKVDTSTGIRETESVKLALFPNPATEYIQLSGANNTRYAIFSIVGKLVSQGITNGETISVSNLSDGVYILKAEGNAMQFIKK